MPDFMLSNILVSSDMQFGYTKSVLEVSLY